MLWTLKFWNERSIFTRCKPTGTPIHCGLLFKHSSLFSASNWKMGFDIDIILLAIHFLVYHCKPGEFWAIHFDFSTVWSKGVNPASKNASSKLVFYRKVKQTFVFETENWKAYHYRKQNHFTSNLCKRIRIIYHLEELWCSFLIKLMLTWLEWFADLKQRSVSIYGHISCDEHI